MISKGILVLLLLNLWLASSVHAQSYTWVKTMGSTYSSGGSITWSGQQQEHVQFLCTDANRNLYAAIMVRDSFLKADTFYQTNGQNKAAENSASLLLTSYTCGGSMRWARLFENRGDVVCYGMQYQAGSIYVAGRFGDSTSPNRYVAGVKISGHDSQHYFLARFDTLGSLRWIRFVGANDQSSAIKLYSSSPGLDDHSLAVDGRGDIHHFVYLNSGVKITSSLTAQKGTYDLKYDTSGSLLGTVRLGVDSNYFLCGQYAPPNWLLHATGIKNSVSISKRSGKVFAVMTDQRTPYSQFRLCAFASGGTLLWEDTLTRSSSMTTNDQIIRDAIYDGDNGIYLSGEGSINRFRLNGVAPTYKPATYGLVSVVIKVDTNGNPQWIYANEHSNGGALGNTIILPNGDILAAGAAGGISKHGKDSVTLPINSSGPFYTIVSPSGNLVKMDVVQRYHPVGAARFNVFTSATVDKTGNIYFGGLQMSDTLRFPGGIISVKAPNVYNVSDAFIARMGLDCRCTGVAKAAFKDSLVNEKTVYFTYTGTTEAIDSIVWYFGGGQKKKVTTGFTLPFSRSYTSGGAYSRDSVLVIVYSGCGVDSAYRYPPPVAVAGLSVMSSLQVYPNPTHTGTFKVVWESPKTIREAVLTLTDITGRLVVEQKLQPNGSTIHEEIAIPQAVPGVYILELRAGNERMLRRVVLQ